MQDQEEESRENDGDMLERSEYYLESLLSDAFKGKGFQKIKEIIQGNDIYPQKYSKQLLNQLDKVLKKELDKNEFTNASLLLKCIQQYCRSDPRDGVNLLLQEGLIAKMVTWFERTREFLSLIEPSESTFLVHLVEDFFDTALIIGKSNTEGKKQLLESFIPYLGHLAADSHVSCFLRQEALRTLNTLLDNTGKEERKKFAGSEEMCLLTKELAKAILDVGDYDIQIAIVEALFRIMLKKWRDDLVHNWFEDQYLAKAFREIKDRDFETDSRLFLNELNERLGDKRRVCSVPCKAAVADTNKLKKPADDKLKEFWIDFNFGSESITFYVDNLEGGLWESVRLAKEAVSSYRLTEEGREKILKMVLKDPMAINKKEVTKIQIHFDSQFDVLTQLFNVMGKDKVMIVFDQDDDVCNGDQPQQSTRVVSRHVEKDLVGSDSLLNVSTLLSVTATSQKIIVPADATATRESQLTGKQNDSQASGDVGAVSETNAVKTPPSLNTSASKASPLRRKDRAVEPSMAGESHLQGIKTFPVEVDFTLAPGCNSTDLVKDALLEKTNAARSSARQTTEEKKDAYEFEYTSDPATHEMVSEMKQKVFVQKAALPRSSSKGDLERRKSGRRLSASYRSNLLSESNQETSSHSESEKSWVLDSQKKLVSKPADYTRKRTRVRSKLKVLPLSSPSSGSDHHGKKVGSSLRGKQRMKPSTELDDIAAMQPPIVSSTPMSHVRHMREPPEGPRRWTSVAGLNDGAGDAPSDDLEMADDTLPIHFSPISSESGASKKHDYASSTLPMEDEVSKSKRKVSDSSAGTSGKRSKLTRRQPRDECSPTIPFVPRKLFNSTEMEEETWEGHNLEELEEDVFFSKILEEGAGDLEVIAAFESFTHVLKKKFWSRYKRMAIYTQNVLRTSEQHILALLNQIHQSRLNELERFHKTVAQELANLEKRTQFLSNLEKDTLEFWTKQSNKLNSKMNNFCIRQMQRIQSMDSELEGAAENLEGAAQNGKFEEAVDHEEERSKASVIASD